VQLPEVGRNTLGQFGPDVVQELVPEMAARQQAAAALTFERLADRFLEVYSNLGRRVGETTRAT
jgi:hypothetical protein